MQYCKKETYEDKIRKRQTHLQRQEQIIDLLGPGGTIVSTTGPAIEWHWKAFRDLMNKYSMLYAVEWNPKIITDMRKTAQHVTADPRLQIVYGDVFDIMLIPGYYGGNGPLSVLDLDLCCTPSKLLEQGFLTRLEKLVQSNHVRQTGLALLLSCCMRNDKKAMRLVNIKGIPTHIDDIFVSNGWRVKKHDFNTYREGAPMWQYFGCFERDYYANGYSKTKR